jgi:MoaA/NifB/PqqE/SkfB family radical SAM enzyme
MNSHQMAYIDIVDTCNLKCQCCPVGSGYGEKSSNRMNLQLFDQITDKLGQDFVGKELFVGLYNWSEPFLHPELPRFLEMLKRKKFRFTISTNLALPNLPTLADVLASVPYSFAISLSGFTQSVYGLTHRGGNIEVVKSNMQILHDLRRDNGLENLLYIAVKWLSYRTNEHERELMRAFAEKLKFGFEVYTACYLPTDRLIACIEGREAPYAGSEMLLTIPNPIKNGTSPRLIDKPIQCRFQENEITIRCNGDIYLCCSLPYKQDYLIGNYLDLSVEEIRARLRTHKTCIACKKNNLHQSVN